MKKLAIRGHKTRGKEVIELLEMLGGKNKGACSGSNTSKMYVLTEKSIDYVYLNDRSYSFVLFTLEDFLEKFPYKVGDKARFEGHECNIIKMTWDDGKMLCLTDFCGGYAVYSCKLQPYKEDWTFSDAEKEFNKAKIKSEYFMKDFVLNAGKLGGKGLLDQMECNYSDLNVAAREAYNNAIKRKKTGNSPNHEKDVLSILEELSEFAKASEEKPSEHLPEYTEAAEELADIIIGCMTELYKRNVDVGSIIRDKMNFNETRQS